MDLRGKWMERDEEGDEGISRASGKFAVRQNQLKGPRN